MNIFEISRLIVPLICFAFLGFGVSRCSDGVNITSYTGWENDCEIAGGVAYDGKCFEPSALISVEATQ